MAEFLEKSSWGFVLFMEETMPPYLLTSQIYSK